MLPVSYSFRLARARAVPLMRLHLGDDDRIPRAEFDGARLANIVDVRGIRHRG